MKNIDITRKITQGMYTLTTMGGGCIIDSVAQVSAGDNPLISIAIMKKNYTNELISKNKRFAVSILGKNVDPEIIKTFGFNSMRDIDKFEKIATTEIEGIKIIKDSLGYMVCEVIDSFENETHVVYIGKIIEADIIDDRDEPMSYGYYQEHKDELFKIKTNKGKTAWICTVCGYIYYGDEVPNDYKCPLCGVSKVFFQRKDKKK